MKPVLILFVAALIGTITLIAGVRSIQQKIDSALSAQPNQILERPTPTPTSPQAREINESLFVPYWSFQEDSFDPPAYTTLIYFGVQVGTTGLDTQEDGYRKVPAFVRAAGNKHKILTVRMIDTKTNVAILKDPKAQDAVITQTLDLARTYGFEGVLLNIEVSALPFASLVDRITTFNTKFAEATHKADLTYSVTAYGDTFYRVRPFDIQKLARHADRVYIMAYDFHKAKGNPGPNFPLSGGETYGYDYTRMLNNFADAVPLSKLIVVFGMYGYDWQVDEQDVSQGVGQAISLREVRADVIDTCQHLSCHWERDSKSAETKAVYKDGDTTHVLWFEDQESVKRKKDFLKSKGVGSYAYWAYSYF